MATLALATRFMPVPVAAAALAAGTLRKGLLPWAKSHAFLTKISPEAGMRQIVRPTQIAP
jgi:hypothetical protein